MKLSVILIRLVILLLLLLLPIPIVKVYHRTPVLLNRLFILLCLHLQRKKTIKLMFTQNQNNQEESGTKDVLLKTKNLQCHYCPYLSFN